MPTVNRSREGAQHRVMDDLINENTFGFCDFLGIFYIFFLILRLIQLFRRLSTLYKCNTFYILRSSCYV